MTDDNELGEYVCAECIGDEYLSAEISRDGATHQCMICKQAGASIGFDELCERVNSIVEETLIRTAENPDSWEMYKDSDVEWEREGDGIDFYLGEMLGCDTDGDLVAAIKERLSDQYYSYDSGIEDPYGDTIQYRQRDLDAGRFGEIWSAFEREIRTRGRFFNHRASDALGEIFKELDRYRYFERPLIREIGPSTTQTALYRARPVKDRDELTRIVQSPAKELGAPPSHIAKNGRMNPRYISMFYGAFDPNTCVAEVRPPVGSRIVIGKFDIVEKLRLLDLGALTHAYISDVSYFDPAFQRLRQRAFFLETLVSIMSRPVQPNDEDYEYLTTQAVAEYLSEDEALKLDGLIFPSSQSDTQGENVVLFGRMAFVQPDGTDELEMRTTHGTRDGMEWEPDVTVWSRRKAKSPDGDASAAWLWDEAWERSEARISDTAALKIDLGSIEIREIKAVSYEQRVRKVYRYDEPKGDLPF